MITDQASCLKILCRTFRHESLVLVLENASKYHPAKLMPYVRTIICPDSSELSEKLGQMSLGADIESLGSNSSQDFSVGDPGECGGVNAELFLGDG